MTLKTEFVSEYVAWLKARQRCTDPDCAAWKNYGGRGITMCEEWQGSFEAFFKHVGAKPNSHLTLERINNSVGYEPGNVCWATNVEQARNTRRSKLIKFRGRVAPLVVWCEELNLDYIAVVSRVRYGWKMEKILSTPTRKPYSSRALRCQ